MIGIENLFQGGCNYSRPPSTEVAPSLHCWTQCGFGALPSLAPVVAHGSGWSRDVPNGSRPKPSSAPLFRGNPLESDFLRSPKASLSGVDAKFHLAQRAFALLLLGKQAFKKKKASFVYNLGALDEDQLSDTLLVISCTQGRVGEKLLAGSRPFLCCACGDPAQHPGDQASGTDENSKGEARCLKILHQTRPTLCRRVS